MTETQDAVCLGDGMQQEKRLRVTKVNPHLICVLCGGYYIDATTITECLHSFCRTCIVKYLETSKYCPVCDTLVHKTKPLLRIRSDHILQDLVYKLVPGLFQDEMRKRRLYYKDDLESGKLPESSVTGKDEPRKRIIFSKEENISLALELSPDGRPPFNPTNRSKSKFKPADRRYLMCPASLSVGHLKKFIRTKFSLCDRLQVDLFHTDEALKDNYTLIDVAYIYLWKREGPLRLYYTVYTNPAKRFKPQPEPETVLDPVPMEATPTLEEENEVMEEIKEEQKEDIKEDEKVNIQEDIKEDAKKEDEIVIEIVVSEPVVSSTQNSQGCQTEPTVPQTVDGNRSEQQHGQTPTTVARRYSQSQVECKPKVETAEVSCETERLDFPDIPCGAVQTAPCDIAVNTEESGPSSAAVGQSIKVQTQTQTDKTEAESVFPSSSVSTGAGTSSPSSPTKRSSPALDPPSVNSQPTPTPKSPVKVTYGVPTFKVNTACSPIPTSSESEPLYKHVNTHNQSKTNSSVSDTAAKQVSKHETLVSSSTPKDPPDIHGSRDTRGICGFQQSPTTTPKATSSKSAKTKSPRPRGRPPKIRPTGDSSSSLSLTATQQQTSHAQSGKSRDKALGYSKHGNGHKQSAQELAMRYASSLNTYAPVSYPPRSNHHHPLHSNKESSKHSSHGSNSSSRTDRPEELKIPKQIVCFTNGQYTLTSVSSKHSSPLSPTTTVSEKQQLLSYGDKYSNSSETSKSHIAKHSPKASTGQSHSKSSNHGNSQGIKSSSNNKDRSGDKSSHTQDTLQCHSKNNGYPVSKDTVSNNNSRISCEGTHREDSQDKARIAVTHDNCSGSAQGINYSLHNNDCHGVKYTSSGSSSSSQSNNSGSKHIKDLDNTTKSTKTDYDVVVSSSVKPTTSESGPFPVYKHTSPFFASMNSSTNRVSTNRPHTHLNIPNPNLALHYASSQLYPHATGRNYVTERLGSPLLHRAIPGLMNGSSNNCDFQAQQKHYHASNNPSPVIRNGGMDSPNSQLHESSVSPVYTPPVTTYHYVTSLPRDDVSPDQNKLVNMKMEPVNGTSNKNITNNNTNNNNNNKSANGNNNNNSRKGKEKSIHHIITALSERRTKKEMPTEQLNGIDLSTRSPQVPEGRQSVGSTGSSGCNGEVDKFAFTDEEDVPLSPQRLHFKQDLYQAPERKNAL